jgi:hypothetical protein
LSKAALFVGPDGQRPVAAGHISSHKQAVSVFPTRIGGDDLIFQAEHLNVIEYPNTITYYFDLV